MEKNCSVKVYPRESFGAFHGYSCTKKVKVEREGKSYCSIHDPEAVKRRALAQNKKWDEENKLRNEKFKREQLVKALVAHIPTSDLENWELRRKQPSP